MKALGYSLPFIILVSGFAGLFVLSSLKKDPPQKAPSKQSALVKVERVTSCTGGFTISVDGEVTPFREISLAAEANGRIAAKSSAARAGNYVRKGDMLFQIDPRDYELEVRRLQEALKQAGSSIEESDVEKTNAEELVALAEEQLVLQRNELKRFESLSARNAASTSQLEKARQSELTSLNALQTLKNQILLINARRNRLLQQKESAMSNLELAELNLSRTKVVSPIDGVVIQDYAEQDDFVTRGSQLIQLEDTSKVEVRFSLRMDQLRWLWQHRDPAQTSGYTYELPDVPVNVRVALDGNEFTWPARISRYDGAGINAGTRTVPVVAVVDDPRSVKLTKNSDVVMMAAPPTLLRGSFVSVDIPVGKDMELVAVPSTAFQPDKTVWIYDNGKLKIQPVKVAYSDENQVVVMADSAALAAGQQVIVSPLPVAEAGMSVRVAGDARNATTSAKTMTASEKKTDAR